ncbi:hypothetical protein GCM10020218_081680 [Dactylosporangium vinaceum]
MISVETSLSTPSSISRTAASIAALSCSAAARAPASPVLGRRRQLHLEFGDVPIKFHDTKVIGAWCHVKRL